MTVVDVAARTTDARRRDAGRFTISDVAFAPDVRLPRHEHPRGCLAIVVDGSVQKAYDHATHDAARGTVIAMPAAEPHADAFGRRGASIVVVECDDRRGATAVFRSWEAVLLAHRARRELSEPDQFTSLALEGLALELTALAGRSPARDARASLVEGAAEILRSRFRPPPNATSLAAELGVHPAHLSRCFSARYGESLGAYARNARLDWAAERLLRTDAPLARVACDAGFADQSHFTRSFVRRFGVPPGRYRATQR